MGTATKTMIEKNTNGGSPRMKGSTRLNSVTEGHSVNRTIAMPAAKKSRFSKRPWYNTGRFIIEVWLIFLVGALASVTQAANVCGESEVLGPYGSQTLGVTRIAAGTPKPAVTLARLVFNADKTVSGYSSVSFDGLLLGNPVTGTYEIKSDCTISWSLQDDSGAYQHFSGTVTPGGNRVDFQQIDPDTGQHGIMEKASDACTDADFRPRYSFTVSGDSIKRVLNATADGTFTTSDGSSGTFKVDSDCIVHIEFDDDETKLRGILVNKGAGILAIEIDPGKTVAARFTAQ